MVRLRPLRPVSVVVAGEQRPWQDGQPQIFWIWIWHRRRRGRARAVDCHGEKADARQQQHVLHHASVVIGRLTLEANRAHLESQMRDEAMQNDDDDTSFATLVERLKEHDPFKETLGVFRSSGETYFRGRLLEPGEWDRALVAADGRGLRCHRGDGGERRARRAGEALRRGGLSSPGCRIGSVIACSAIWLQYARTGRVQGRRRA